MRPRQQRLFVATSKKQVLLTILAVLCFLATGEAADRATTLVGVAEVDITPDTPVRMYGYASRKTESEGIAGRLKAKALAIGEDAELAVLLTVDCGAVTTDIRQEVFRRIRAKKPLQPKRFMLCNSHCHSGPDLKGRKKMEGEQREHLESYVRTLTDRLTEVMVHAIAAREPCEIGWATGSVGFAANRRVLTEGKWSGFGAVQDAPSDHSLPVLRVKNTQGDLVAVLVNYACHCTTLRGNFKRIHGDWAACAQQYIEADHPGTIAMSTIGCGADQDPCPHSTVALCEQHGRAMADEVARLLQEPFGTVTPHIVAKQETLSLPYQDLDSVEELEKRVGKSWALASLLEKIKNGEKIEPRTYQVSTWTFGDDLAMVFLSDEVVVDFALRMKQEMDGSRLWITAYTNEVRSYIASERVIQEGGYESRNSLSNLISFGQPETVQPAMEDRIVQTVAKLLPASFQKPSSENR